jgi:hypothetical protein
MSSKIGTGDQSAQRMMLLMAVITEREKESPSSRTLAEVKKAVKTDGYGCCLLVLSHESKLMVEVCVRDGGLYFY